jgi:hypothetical protein
MAFFKEYGYPVVTPGKEYRVKLRLAGMCGLYVYLCMAVCVACCSFVSSAFIGLGI